MRLFKIQSNEAAIWDKKKMHTRDKETRKRETRQDGREDWEIERKNKCQTGKNVDDNKDRKGGCGIKMRKKERKKIWRRL